MEKLDIRGRICPIPLFHTKRKLKGLLSGDILEVIVDDETAQDTIPHWCQIHNHDILSLTEDEINIIFALTRTI